MDVRLTPQGPYSLRLSTRLPADGVLKLDGVLVWQTPAGLVARAESEEALELARWRLALDDDHTEFLRRFAGDPLLGRAVLELRGLRPGRLSTVAHALLRAVCGQLVESRRAFAMERALVRACGVAPPTREALGALSPAQVRRSGLAASRSATLVRVCRSLDVERLRSVPVEAAAARLLRERGLGPWSLGVIGLEGLGTWRYGLVGDLGLIKLCSALRGRWVEAWETEELLAPYGEWAGLASVYLLKGWARGLIPGASGAEARRVRFAA